jgi:AAA15 family ATPase/GTPase
MEALMLNSLMIRNFRALENFEVSKLGRVNLIVGKNNSGKSSVLEALQIYASNGQLSLLDEILTSHDEKLITKENGNEEMELYIPFQNFFTGRVFPSEDDEISIEIGELNNIDSLKIDFGHFSELREESRSDITNESIVRVRRNRVKLKEVDLLNMDNIHPAIIIEKNTQSRIIPFERFSSRSIRQSLIFGDIPQTPCSTIPTQFISIDELASEWDKIALTEYQDIVKDALSIVSNEILDIAFVKNDDGYPISGTRVVRSAYSRTAIVRLKNMSKPVPLKSMGDGMLRVLQLVLKVFSAKGGLLLIDEFENGLHFSVQKKVWELVFNLAEKLNIQVFATTHSWDCIESFAQVAFENQEVEGVLFRVGKSIRTSDKGNVIATVFNEKQLFDITQADVEIR